MADLPRGQCFPLGVFVESLEDTTAALKDQIEKHIILINVSSDWALVMSPDFIVDGVDIRNSDET
jgi:hypothetical protein